MRFFKRPTIEPVTSEPEPAEPENIEEADAAKPELTYKDAVKNDLALAMAQYGSQDDIDAENSHPIISYSPIVLLTDTILRQAIKEGASQILIEPDKRALRVRHRIDGKLDERMAMPEYMKQVMLARFCILAEINLAALKSPQSGRIIVSYEGVSYTFRVNSTPTEHGESLSMRVLDRRPFLMGLKGSGMNAEIQVQVEDLIQEPRGIFLVTGPVGCGKSVTLYSLMNRLNGVERHCAVIESEAEYALGGVTAVRADAKNGLTYAEAFRGLVRAEAEIILAERLPDAESWDAALTASEEGTLVMASMNLRDATTALWRLRNMGLDAERISQNVTGILAQRLVRKICVHCKEFYEVNALELAPLGLRLKNTPEKVTLARGAGCDQCRKTGYKGQIGIFSLLRVNQEIRGKIVRGDFSPDLFEAALANGMHPLREDGLEKILLGLTTVDEVYAVVGH